MSKTLRFHLDEHVAGAIGDGLRRRGIDVTTTSDAGLRGAPDTAHLAFGLAQGRVVFTSDEDYLVLHSAGTPHAGFAYCHQQRRFTGDVIRGLVLLWQVLEPEDMVNHVEFI